MPYLGDPFEECRGRQGDRGALSRPAARLRRAFGGRIRTYLLGPLARMTDEDDIAELLKLRMGIDVGEVIDAAASKPFGFMPFRPGPGLGGHCIPIDPYYLTWKAREYGLTTRFIELAGETGAALVVVGAVLITAL